MIKKLKSRENTAYQRVEIVDEISVGIGGEANADEVLMDKINEIIDYLNEQKKCLCFDSPDFEPGYECPIHDNKDKVYIDYAVKQDNWEDEWEEGLKDCWVEGKPRQGYKLIKNFIRNNFISKKKLKEIIEGMKNDKYEWKETMTWNKSHVDAYNEGKRYTLDDLLKQIEEE